MEDERRGRCGGRGGQGGSLSLVALRVGCSGCFGCSGSGSGCRQSLLGSADAKSYRPNTKTLGDQEFHELAAGMVITSPELAATLGHVLRYFKLVRGV
jgi:hypothetical protein